MHIDLGENFGNFFGENVDCVVRGGEIIDQSLMARHVGDLNIGIYAAPGYLQRFGTPAHPRELEEGRHSTVGFLWFRTGKSLPYAMRRGEERIEAQGRPQLTVDDGNAYLAAGLAGLGMLWLPQYMWPNRTWSAASCCRCLRTGTWRQCRCPRQYSENYSRATI